MKRPKFLLFFIALFLGFQLSVKAQYIVPDNYSFRTKEEYHKYDKEIMKCIKFLEKTKPGDQKVEVRAAARFLGEWLTGCPYVNFKENVRIDAVIADSKEYRIFYMCGWVKYALQNQEKPDRVLCTVAGLQDVIKAYKSHGSKKYSNLDELVKRDEKGKLQEWVDERLH